MKGGSKFKLKTGTIGVCPIRVMDVRSSKEHHLVCFLRKRHTSITPTHIVFYFLFYSPSSFPLCSAFFCFLPPTLTLSVSLCVCLSVCVSVCVSLCVCLCVCLSLMHSFTLLYPLPQKLPPKRPNLPPELFNMKSLPSGAEEEEEEEEWKREEKENDNKGLEDVPDVPSGPLQPSQSTSPEASRQHSEEPTQSPKPRGRIHSTNHKR